MTDDLPKTFSEIGINVPGWVSGHIADEVWGGDPCPRCGTLLDYDEDGDDRDPYLWCPAACGFVPNGYPHHKPKP